MRYPMTLRVAVPLLLLALGACESDTRTETAAPSETRSTSETASRAPETEAANGPGAAEGAGTPIEHTLVPLPGKAVPVLTRVSTVVLETTAGNVTIEVYPEAAPNAAERFVRLVESGYYDGTPVSRVIPGFVAQFGINWRTPHRGWRDRPFNDDPTLFALERGTLAFAKAGPNTNSTQVFINYRENNYLASPEQNFTVFGKVVDGMDVVDAFVPLELDQARLWSDGEALIESLEVKPTMIERAYVR